MKDLRHASRQAWRRLRRHVTDSELRDISKDIAGEITGELPLDVEIYQALAAVNFENRRQA